MQENIINKICRELGITQIKLSDITNIDKANISRWKSGKRDAPKYIENYFNTLIKLDKYERLTYSTKVSKI